MKKSSYGVFLALLAAALYSVSIPLSKILLQFMPSTLMAGILYLGAGIGMCILALVRTKGKNIKAEEPLTLKELPYTLAMIILDIAAPISLLFGLRTTNASNASLLNNFEIVATAIIAFVVFKETIGPRLLGGIIIVTLACLILSFENFSSLHFSFGSLFILLACVCWGLENNCTRKISSKDPLEIVLLKGTFSGLGAFMIGLFSGERLSSLWSVFAVLFVGFIAYGLSIFFYVYAQRILGAARTSAYYAIAPFFGAILSLLILQEIPHLNYSIAFAVMLAGARLCTQKIKPLAHNKLF